LETEKTFPLLLIDESIIKDSDAECGGVNNAFSRVLKKGEELRRHGLDPIYLYDEIQGIIEVRSRTRYEGKLN
jgi:hypothetical protein